MLHAAGRGSICKKRWPREGDEEFPFVDARRMVGQGLLLDTCVYIDQMQDRSPQALDDLIAQRQVNHSTIAIQELTHTVGVLNPTDANRWCHHRDRHADQAMPPHRMRLELTSATGALEQKIQTYAPRMVAFLGKAAYEAIVAKPVSWGLQPDRFSDVPVWVLPNPSGLNRYFSLTDLVRTYKELHVTVD